MMVRNVVGDRLRICGIDRARPTYGVYSRISTSSYLPQVAHILMSIDIKSAPHAKHIESRIS
jgi:hypothetical protein